MRLKYVDLTKAYLKAIKGKSKQKQIISRNIDLENNMQKLYHDLVSEKYQIGRSTRYIVSDPVIREIIVIPFRDRIVQHLVHSYIYPYFDRIFVYDNYANRKGKGTLAAILRADHFMRSCTDNYQKDCHIMKLDIQSFFASIDHDILRDILMRHFWKINSTDWDIIGIFGLMHHIIYHPYIYDMIDKADPNLIPKLPKHKSIIYISSHKGLPLGNLTSQLFANIYMHELDIYIKHTLAIKHYARYVDDFIIFDSDCEYLLDCKNKIQSFLLSKLLLKLHPDKIYIQHYTKGVKLLGIHIYPYCRIVGQRILGGFVKACKLADRVGGSENTFSINSYIGLMKHHNSYGYITNHHKITH